MMLRILGRSFGRQKRRKAIAFLAVALGTATTSAVLNIALGVRDQMSRELRSFGANLVVEPAGQTRPVRLAGRDLTRLRPPAYLDEKDVLKVKDNFWVHNILAMAPVLEVEAQVRGRRVRLLGTWFQRRVQLDDGTAFTTGIRRVYPFWTVEGRWTRDEAGAGSEAHPALVGRSLARVLNVSPGDTVHLGVSGRETAFQVTGILTAGGEEDRAILTTLDRVQELAGLDGKVGRILVSALTTPEDRAVTRLGLAPAHLSRQEFEEWSCTPFVSSIAYELEMSVAGSAARPIRKVAETEGRVLERIAGLLALIASMAVLASVLAVTSALTTGVLERRAEIGLFKSLGATNGRVVGFFLAEAALTGVAGGLAGGAAGAWLARDLSRAVFGSTVELSPVSLPLAVLAAVGITLAGCALPARRIVSFRPFQVLHGL